MAGKPIVNGRGEVARRFGLDLERVIQHGPLAEAFFIVVLAVVVGIIGGFGAYLFHWMIGTAGRVFGWAVGAAGGGMPWRTALFRALSPAAGLFIVVATTTFLAKEVKGHGVPQLLEALALRGGRLRWPVAVFGTILPAVTIGSGGSAGPEGPIAQIGGAFGSLFAQLLRLPDKYVSLLLACGSAAGIAATFKAPIAGAFFGLEVILGSYAMGAVVPVFVSALVGTTLFERLEGTGLVTPTPAYTVVHPTELGAMLLLGILAGAVGLLYTRGLTIGEDFFENLPWPWWLPPLVGGAIVGLLGLIWPDVLGVGYKAIQDAAAGKMAIGLMAILLVGKFVATVLTLGAGGTGGVLAPSLYLGAMLGGTFGGIGHIFFPNWMTSPAVYAVTGMGAVFAASAQAPLTAVTIVLEMTGDYRITTGVMAACSVAYLLHGSVFRDSMFTVRLARRGLVILRGTDVRMTERIPVKVALAPSVVVGGNTTVAQAIEAIETAEVGVVVVQDGQQVVGLAGLNDLRAVAGEDTKQRPIGEFIRRDFVSVDQHDSLEEAMRLLTLYDLPALPVIDASSGDADLVGVVTPESIMRAYSTQTLVSLEAGFKTRLLREDYGDRGGFGEAVIRSQSPVLGLPLAEVRLPRECVVVSVQRGGEVRIPHGDTVLQTDDRVLLYCAPASRLDDVIAWLSGRSTDLGTR